MPEPPERWNMFVDDPDVAGEISEWIEQEGKAWDEVRQALFLYTLPKAEHYSTPLSTLY